VRALRAPEGLPQKSNFYREPVKTHEVSNVVNTIAAERRLLSLITDTNSTCKKADAGLAIHRQEMRVTDANDIWRDRLVTMGTHLGKLCVKCPCQGKNARKKMYMGVE